MINIPQGSGKNIPDAEKHFSYDRKKIQQQLLKKYYTPEILQKIKKIAQDQVSGVDCKFPEWSYRLANSASEDLSTEIKLSWLFNSGTKFILFNSWGKDDTDLDASNLSQWQIDLVKSLKHDLRQYFGQKIIFSEFSRIIEALSPDNLTRYFRFKNDIQESLVMPTNIKPLHYLKAYQGNGELENFTWLLEHQEKQSVQSCIGVDFEGHKRMYGNAAVSFKDPHIIHTSSQDSYSLPLGDTKYPTRGDKGNTGEILIKGSKIEALYLTSFLDENLVNKAKEFNIPVYLMTKLREEEEWVTEASPYAGVEDEEYKVLNPIFGNPERIA
jgi:hypothetical protein